MSVWFEKMKKGVLTAMFKAQKTVTQTTDPWSEIAILGLVTSAAGNSRHPLSYDFCIFVSKERPKKEDLFENWRIK